MNDASPTLCGRPLPSVLCALHTAASPVVFRLHLHSPEGSLSPPDVRRLRSLAVWHHSLAPFTTVRTVWARRLLLLLFSNVVVLLSARCCDLRHHWLGCWPLMSETT
jgi:hypothetical protein